MYAQQILLFLLVNFFHLFLGCGYLSLPALHQRSRRPLFLAAWAALLLALNLLCAYILTGTAAALSAAIVALVLLSSAVTLYLYGKSQRKTETELKETLYNRQLEYYARQYQEISRSQREIRQMRHELKNNYILLETFAKNKDTDSILACLPQMYQTEPDRLTARTGNMVVDSVINHRVASAEADGICFQLNLNIPTQLDTSDIRLCGLLGNALDNAIEAVLRVPKEQRRIRISMEIEKKNLFIEISNPYDGTILSDSRGRLLTRKENTSRHGYGMSVMEELLRNNLGSMEASWDGSTFRLCIILYSVI